DETIVVPLVHVINGVEGITSLESEASDSGSALIVVRFAPKTDPTAARMLVQKRVALAEPLLPEVCRWSAIPARNGDPAPLPNLWIAVTGSDDALALGVVAGRVQEAIVSVPCVADARVVGPSGSALRVWLDPDRLVAYNLTVQDVVAALRRQDVLATA